MIYRILALTAALGLVAGVSCNDANEPVAGTLRVRLTMPAASSGLDAAILFTVAGPTPPVSAAAGTGLREFHEPLAATTKYAVTGTLTSGATILTFRVDDVRQRHTATIQQVAMSSGYQLRTSLNGYSLLVTR